MVKSVILRSSGEGYKKIEGNIPGNSLAANHWGVRKKLPHPMTINKKNPIRHLYISTCNLRNFSGKTNIIHG